MLSLVREQAAEIDAALAAENTKQEQIAAAEKTAAEFKPAWLSEYELQQRLLAPASDAPPGSSGQPSS